MRRLKSWKLLTLGSIAVVSIAGLAAWKFSSRDAVDATTSNEPSPTVPVDPSGGGRVPVPDNRGPDVGDGFSGETHPLLTDSTPILVEARWKPIGSRRESVVQQLPEEVYRMFLDLAVVDPERAYEARDFSAFLPPEIGEVGQMWAIDPDRLAPLLTQFHPNPQMYVTANGRRAGPDGVFALLRAVSPAHLDVVFRAHADFQLARNVWYTPAYFEGRLLVNRRAGTVEYFHLSIPIEKTLNVHMTAVAVDDGTPPDIHRPVGIGEKVMTRRDIVHSEQMELVAGDLDRIGTISWTRQTPLIQARKTLRKAFYKFMEIDWVPFNEALPTAQQTGHPILAVVMWGSLDDQSC